jgi:predicted Fe-Mo cluster-binding NifX family protein
LLMNIAVAYEAGKVCPHLGRCPSFKIYEIQDGQVVSSRLVEAGDGGPGARAALLERERVEVLLCGGMRNTAARAAMTRAGIKLCCAVEGDADQSVGAYLDGSLVYSQEADCDSPEHGGCGHGHEQGHCGHGERHGQSGCGQGQNREHCGRGKSGCGHGRRGCQ